MQLIDGKVVAAQATADLAAAVAQLTAAGHRPPHLAAVLVGNDGASETYVASKVKSCEEVGFRSTLLRYPATITQAELLAVVARLNSDPEVDGFIVQLPLPAHLSAEAVTLAIDPAKDVDGFHPANLGRMALNLPAYIPATPYGIVQMLAHYQIETSGKHCVVVGRSPIVGLPISILLGRNTYPGNCTVTLTHSRTPDLAAHTRQADLLIAALGRPGFITAEMVKPGAVVIDVGITRVPDATKKTGFRIQGDVDFAAVAPLASYITPVPGGVGLMTVASLLKNTLLAAQRRGLG
ncbi:MAG: bifunctional 5,10-methylene-tetrahydrofolate dehydrogenase/5,10-methylene-tetrahydrofolate cyclohydrolase [Bernardetiaceae bacterium]|jgi:methylenetetrahydrofolate dehydrogenase (NADP+)/methenyltetrahydrofolate cyclohydrolase|nr:bifunctional 5,10-methylene-tetrahydrofolate dehydrogenase/5,10-methylene-tetrahydrofolate cyclohydrolase [Bernardetiaceae bacterium]